MKNDGMMKTNIFEMMPKNMFRGEEKVKQDAEFMPHGKFMGGEQQGTETLPKGTFRSEKKEQQDIELMPRGRFMGGEQQDIETMPKGTFR